jgi:PAS domain S-box-containing protein
MISNEKVVGVIELASFHPFSEHGIEFIKRIAENLAATIQTVKVNEETKKLLEDSQLRAEQMQAQEEEMRQNMEEMQATQEEMARLKNQSDYIFENLDGVIFICNNDDSFSMEFMSKAMEDLSGYSAEDFVSGRKSLVDIFTKDTIVNMREWIEIPMQEAFDTDQYYRIEYSLKHKNGTEIEVIEKGRGVSNDYGEVYKIVGFITRK